MSTQESKLQAIADAIREKDGTVGPIVANEFPDRIRAIPTREGPKPHSFRVILPDGSIHLDEHLDTGESAAYPTDLPAPDPALELVEWTHTPAEISNFGYRPSERGATHMPEHIDIGPVYKTVNDCTVIDITAVASNSMLFTLYFSKVETLVATINIRWGDGSAVETFTLSAATAAKNHTYTTKGNYRIEVWSTDHVLYGMGNGSTSTQIVTTGKEGVRRVYFSDYCVLKSHHCYNFTGLEEISLSAVHPMQPNGFNGCPMLKCLILPRINTTVPEYALNNAYRVRHVVIPPTVEALGKYACAYTVGIDKLILPRGITEIPENLGNGGSATLVVSDPLSEFGQAAFNSCYLVSIPNLAMRITTPGTNAFQNCFSLSESDLEVVFTSNMTASMNWTYQITGTLTVDGTVPIAIGGLNFCHGVEKMVIGENVTSITGSITPPECLVYEFMSNTPPALSNASVLSSINKLGELYVPDEAIEAYRTAANWSAANVVKFIKPRSEMPA